MSRPFSTVPKTSFINVPLLIALFITSVIHLLLISKLKMAVPEIEKKHNQLFITIIKVPQQTAPAPEKTISVAPLPIAKTPPVQKTEQHTSPLINPPKLKKRHKVHHPVPERAAIAPPDPVIAENVPVPVPEVVPVPVAEVAPSPIESAPVIVPVVPSPVEPAPVIVPDTPAVPVIPEPIPTAKVEINPILPEEPAPVVTAPAEIDKAAVQPDSAQTDTIDKPADLPIKPAKKSRKKSTSKTSPHNPAPLSMDDLAMQIAQVGEKFGNQAPTASENRIKPLKSVRKHNVSARQYILDWQHKVERIGNTNFPEAARQKDFSAQLVMEVGINVDGTIHSVRIKKSSGTPALDEAAKNIVRMGEPYAALPKDLAQELDVLIIQRTWQFSDESGMTTR